MRRLLLQIAGSNANEAAKRKGRENMVKKKKIHQPKEPRPAFFWFTAVLKQISEANHQRKRYLEEAIL